MTIVMTKKAQIYNYAVRQMDVVLSDYYVIHA